MKWVDLLDSINQKFNNALSGLAATNTQDAIDEVDANFDAHVGDNTHLPAGGTAAQYVRKQSAADHDVLWEDLKLADDPAPILGGDLQTNGNTISLQDATPVEQGQIKYDATIDGVYLAFIADESRGFDPLTDGGVLAKAGELTLSGSIVELNAFKGGSENLQVYVSGDGVLYGVVPPEPGWEESDTDNADYNFPTLGTWVNIVGLAITIPQDVAVGDRVDAFINLYFQELSGNRGGSVDIGIGINGASPTTALNNSRMEGGFDGVISTSITTTTHGGLTTGDTINVFVRRSTQDQAQFDPNLFGSIDPSELIVSVPGEGGGGGGSPTNLGNTPGPSSVTITSSTGADTVVAGAVSGTAGVMTGAQVDALNGKGDLASNNSWSAENVFLGAHNVGDPGTEVSSVLLDGISYPVVSKINRFGTGNTAEFVIHRHSTVDGSNLVFSRALSNDATHANVANGTVLGDIQFTGWGDSSYWSGAVVQAVVDGAPGASDMPTRIDFLTSADGSFNPVNRMSIRASGTVEVVGALTVGGGVINASSIVNWNTAYGWGDHAVAGYEPGLGNPASDGYVLSSTAAGVRSWVPPGGAADLSNAEFPDSAHFASEVVADATVAFTDSNKQSVNATTHPNLTLTAPGVGNYVLKILNSSNLASITPTPLWDSGNAPVWAGTAVLALYYDGTDYYGSAIVGAA